MSISKRLAQKHQAKQQNEVHQERTTHRNIFQSSSNNYVQIELDSIDVNPHQPRSEFDQSKLEELAYSINELGLLQPIVVRPAKTGHHRYEIVAGERRFRACQILGRSHIDCIIMHVDDDNNALLALAENLTREDLSDYEVAKAILVFEKNFPNRKNFAQILGISRQTLYRYLAYGKLPIVVVKYLEATPSLISAPSAENLVQLIKEYQDEVSADQLNLILELTLDALLRKSIKQSELIAIIRRSLEDDLPNKTPEPKTLRIFEVDGKKVSSIKINDKKAVIQINSEFVAGKEEEILKFVEGLIGRQQDGQELLVLE